MDTVFQAAERARSVSHTLADVRAALETQACTPVSLELYRAAARSAVDSSALRAAIDGLTRNPTYLELTASVERARKDFEISTARFGIMTAMHEPTTARLMRDLEALSSRHLIREHTLSTPQWALSHTVFEAAYAAQSMRTQYVELLQKAGLTGDLFARYATLTGGSSSTFWASLTASYRHVAIRDVLPRLAAAGRFLAGTNFQLISGSVGVSLAQSLERDLSLSAHLVRTDFVTHFASLPDMAPRKAAIVEHGVRLASDTLRWSTRSAFALQSVEIRRIGGGGVRKRLIRRLRNLHPSLAVMYAGALETRDRRGADWQRQVASSLRELVGHVLKRLAPEPAVAAWLRQRGAPVEFTVRKQIQFLRNSPVDAEVTGLEALFDALDRLCAALNAPVHALDYDRPGAIHGYVRVVEGCLLMIFDAAGDIDQD